MCEVLDRVENRGIQKGIAQGMEKGIAQGMEKGIAQGMEKGIVQGMEKGIAQGMEKGIIRGEDKILSLMHYLFTNNRLEDARRATEDEAYRSRLLTEIMDKK